MEGEDVIMDGEDVICCLLLWRGIDKMEVLAYSLTLQFTVKICAMYSGIADLLKLGLFHWTGDASTFERGGSSSFIEIVCFPNNLDGVVGCAVLDSEAGKRVHDLAYYWPQYTLMHGPVNEDIMLFTVSKAIRHADTGIRWALVKDADIAHSMVKFIEMNLIGISNDSQVRAAHILQVVSDGYVPDSKGVGRLFHFIRCLLGDRWPQLHQAVEESGRFSLHAPVSIGVVRVHKGTHRNLSCICMAEVLVSDDESIKDCEGFFKRIKMLTWSGKQKSRKEITETKALYRRCKVKRNANLYSTICIEV